MTEDAFISKVGQEMTPEEQQKLALQVLEKLRASVGNGNNQFAKKKEALGPRGQGFVGFKLSPISPTGKTVVRSLGITGGIIKRLRAQGIPDTDFAHLNQANKDLTDRARAGDLSDEEFAKAAESLLAEALMASGKVAEEDAPALAKKLLSQPSLKMKKKPAAVAKPPSGKPPATSGVKVPPKPTQKAKPSRSPASTKKKDEAKSGGGGGRESKEATPFDRGKESVKVAQAVIDDLRKQGVPDSDFRHLIGEVEKMAKEVEAGTLTDDELDERSVALVAEALMASGKVAEEDAPATAAKLLGVKQKKNPGERRNAIGNGNNQYTQDNPTKGSKDLETRAKDVVLFHGTTSKVLRSIAVNGLKPTAVKDRVNARADEVDIDGVKGSVFMTASHELAAGFAQFTQAHKGGNSIVLKVRVPAEHAHLLTTPEGTFGEVAFHDVIPPEWIEPPSSWTNAWSRYRGAAKDQVFFVVIPVDETDEVRTAHASKVGHKMTLEATKLSLQVLARIRAAIGNGNNQYKRENPTKGTSRETFNKSDWPAGKLEYTNGGFLPKGPTFSSPLMRKAINEGNGRLDKRVKDAVEARKAVVFDLQKRGFKVVDKTKHARDPQDPHMDQLTYHLEHRSDGRVATVTQGQSINGDTIHIRLGRPGMRGAIGNGNNQYKRDNPTKDSKDSGTYKRPPVHKVSNIQEAIDLVLAGEVVELPDVRAVNTILTKLQAMVEDAKAKGAEAPNYDLCKVTVPGTNLFCSSRVRTEEHPEGIPRIEMPQLGGRTIPGTKAAALPHKNGEADGSEQFMSHLKSLGIETSTGKVPAAKLKATQNELRGATVAGMVANRAFDPGKNPIFISRDNYVIDGHHRWAAVVGRDTEDGSLGDLTMNVIRVDAPITEILKLATDWSLDFGFEPAAGVKKKR